VFRLHSASAARGLLVCLDGLRLRRGCRPACLGVTLGRALSCGGRLAGTAGELGGRGGLLMRLAGSTWGAGANALRSSALALCYSAAECCAPV